MSEACCSWGHKGAVKVGVSSLLVAQTWCLADSHFGCHHQISPQKSYRNNLQLIARISLCHQRSFVASTFGRVLLGSFLRKEFRPTDMRDLCSSGTPGIRLELAPCPKSCALLVSGARRNAHFSLESTSQWRPLQRSTTHSRCCE
jgi:hypothetical protein